MKSGHWLLDSHTHIWYGCGISRDQHSMRVACDCKALLIFNVSANHKRLPLTVEHELVMRWFKSHTVRWSDGHMLDIGLDLLPMCGEKTVAVLSNITAQ